MDTAPEVPPLGGAGDTRQPAGPDATNADAESESPISADELFYVLRNSRRRAVIRYLHDREPPVEMRDVTEPVAAWEADTTVAELEYAKRKVVYISLYQKYLIE